MACQCSTPVTTVEYAGWQQSCFASLFAFGLAIYSYLVPNPDFNIKNIKKVHAEYDFIIIGGGSAGAVIANRLTEECKWTVLVIEAGCHETEITDIPYTASYLETSDFDWQYRAEPPEGDQRYCQSMVNQRCKFPRGKVVGGTSVINYMTYIRGNRQDYDNWASMGNTGWGYEDVLKYFKKSEDNTIPGIANTQYHSSGGYLTVGSPYTSPLANIFIEGGISLGYKQQDYNGANQTSFSRPQATIRKGSRCSTSKAFIAPIQNRKNLFISTCSFVTRIGFNQTGTCKPKATNVTFVKNNQTYVVRAKKEIILSAGAISSAQILMLSGIGPQEHLKELGIPVIKNLKVGQNFQDHAGSPLSFKVDRLSIGRPSLILNPDNLGQYLVRRTGPFTSISGIDGLAFINTKYAPSNGSYPDVELLTTPFSIYNTGQQPIGNEFYNLRPGLFNGTGYSNLEDEDLFTVFAVCSRPESRGFVKLRTTNPYDHPIIVPNYYSQSMDAKIVIDGLDVVRKLAASPPFQSVNATILGIHFPGCENHDLYSVGYFDCYIRHFTMSFYDPVGTCAMGVGEDAVVDPRLRVHGIESLRVIDGSIMPNITTGNTNAPIIMIGEKGSDMIKQDWLDETSMHADN